MSERLDRFVSLMKGIFELDKSDLDFGIYRIMNIRKQEIEKFLSEGLPQKVQETLAPFACNTGDIEKRLAEIEQSLGTDISQLPDSIPMVKKYKELKSQLAAGVDLSALETDVYSALYSFFNRYYDEGDFISKRRYKEGVYAIPYEGEEVKLYWANQDQYYIKTAENFKDYSFVARNAYGDSCTVHFLLVDATTEQNNNKESKDSKRTFMLYQETAERPELKTFEYRADTNEFIVRFVFDVPEDKKAKYLELNGAAIRQKIAADYPQLVQILLTDVSTDKKKPKTLIDKHLEAYVAKNTFDYFIHKDLKAFLYRELDFYIKSEIIHLDDLDTPNEQRVETYLAKVKAIKRVGHIIIDFLAQVEDFQKKLWLKKKFVVETNWCMTLDRIDESFWPEIIANAAQIQEWIEMYAIDEVEGDLTTVGWTNPPTLDFLRQNQNLVVDTKHFSTDFKDRLVASIEDLDEQTGGLMVNGDNFHGLRILSSRMKRNIKCITIDPPYNTEEDRTTGKFCYKDSFPDSSWISMMYDRYRESLKLLSYNGLTFTTIGDDELYNLQQLLNTLFGKENFKANIIWNSRRSKQNDIDISLAHNYVLAYSIEKTKDELYGEPLKEEEFSNPDNDPKGKWKTSPLDAPGIRERTSFFPIINPQTGMEYFPPKGRHWTVFEEDVPDLIKEGRIFFGLKGKTKPQWKRYWSEVQEDSKTVSTLWDDVDTATEATKELENLLGNKRFETPKPVSLISKIVQQSTKGNESVLDFFAGSGTTGHAVLSMNRFDNGNRKYILIEMGDYFGNITLPRMKKAIYSPTLDTWKNGKPTSRNTGMSHIMKYFSLESYEDALSNVQLSDENHSLYSLLGEDYLIHYMLDIESKGSLLDLEQFKTPFSYKMKITEHNETKNRRVDLVETFNYLIGLSVARQSTVSYFRAAPDTAGSYEGAVRLLKDDGGEFGFKQVEGTLPDGRRTLVIWRTVTDDVLASNAALDAYFTKHRINPHDREFDVIYVNGDNNLENLRTGEESWKVQMIETEFKNRMFEEV